MPQARYARSAPRTRMRPPDLYQPVSHGSGERVSGSNGARRTPRVAGLNSRAARVRGWIACREGLDRALVDRLALLAFSRKQVRLGDWRRWQL